jgi:hypothetical protein
LRVWREKKEKVLEEKKEGAREEIEEIERGWIWGFILFFIIYNLSDLGYSKIVLKEDF